MMQDDGSHDVQAAHTRCGAPHPVGISDWPDDVCKLRLSMNGSVSVRWQKHIAVPHGVRRGVVTVAARLVNIQCEGEGIAWWRVKLGRDGTAVWFEFEPSARQQGGPVPRRRVELRYSVAADRIGTVGSLYEFGSDGLPHVHRKWPSLLRGMKDSRVDHPVGTIVELEWERGVRCFGPPLDPIAGNGVVRLSKAELDDLRIQFGAFRLAATSNGLQVWVPEGEGTGWSRDDLRLVTTWAARAYALLTELFGPLSRTLDHILAIPRPILATVAGRLPGQYFGNAVRITDPRVTTSEWTHNATTRLASQLSHEMSHAWWVPITVPWSDDRAWSFAEAVATASEHLVLGRSLQPELVRKVLDHAATFHSVYLTRRFDEHRARYRKGAAGLRTGYFLSALLADQGQVTLKALRRLFDVLAAAEPNARPLDALFEEALGTPLARQLLSLLMQPRPPVAVVRIQRADSTEGPGVSIRFSTRTAAARFDQQLRATRLCRDDIQSSSLSGRAVVVSFKPGHDAESLLPLLNPGFLVYKWDLQAHRVSRNLVLSALFKRGESLSEDPTPTVTRQALRAVVGLALIFLFSESPLGYRLTASVSNRWATQLARLLSEAAVARGGS